MKAITILSIGLFLSFCISGCKESKKIMVDGIEVKNLIEIKKDVKYVQPVSNPAFVIEDWSIAGDVAKLVINYSGGCGVHKFKAFFTGAYLKSMPPKAGIFIQHENSGDKCRKLVMDTLYVNLKPMRYEKDKAGSVIISFNNTEKTLEYSYKAE